MDAHSLLDHSILEGLSLLKSYLYCWISNLQLIFIIEDDKWKSVLCSMVRWEPLFDLMSYGCLKEVLQVQNHSCRICLIEGWCFSILRMWGRIWSELNDWLWDYEIGFWTRRGLVLTNLGVNFLHAKKNWCIPHQWARSKSWASKTSLSSIGPNGPCPTQEAQSDSSQARQAKPGPTPTELNNHMLGLACLIISPNGSSKSLARLRLAKW